MVMAGTAAMVDMPGMAGIQEGNPQRRISQVVQNEAPPTKSGHRARNQCRAGRRLARERLPGAARNSPFRLRFRGEYGILSPVDKTGCCRARCPGAEMKPVNLNRVMPAKGRKDDAARSGPPGPCDRRDEDRRGGGERQRRNGARRRGGRHGRDSAQSRARKLPARGRGADVHDEDQREPRTQRDALRQGRRTGEARDRPQGRRGLRDGPLRGRGREVDPPGHARRLAQAAPCPCTRRSAA